VFPNSQIAGSTVRPLIVRVKDGYQYLGIEIENALVVGGGIFFWQLEFSS
jgi:hypothetical protein